MNKTDFWNVNNVSSFRNIDVTNGEVDMSEEEYCDYLDDIYGNVTICGMQYSAGNALRLLDPVAFRCGMGEEESRLQADLEEQLENEDSSGIEFIDGDEDFEDYDYGYAAFKAGEDCDENESDDWVAGWNDAKNNKEYDEENPAV